jgi:hypothetical protein
MKVRKFISSWQLLFYVIAAALISCAIAMPFTGNSYVELLIQAGEVIAYLIGFALVYTVLSAIGDRLVTPLFGPICPKCHERMGHGTDTGVYSSQDARWSMTYLVCKHCGFRA